MKKGGDLKSFHYLENGEISYSTINTIKSVQKLDAGSYKLTYLEYPDNRVLIKKDGDMETSKIYTFLEKATLDEFMTSFFNEEIMEAVKDFGFYHKAGILFHGNEGTGKTSIMKHYYKKLIEENDALVFHITSRNYRFGDCWDFVTNVRKIQDNPIVIVLDEFDSYVKENESLLKTIIDGNMSIDKCLFMASTNYLDTIPNAMKKRKSRFKYVIEIGGIHDGDEILTILQKMLGKICETKEIEEFSKTLKGCSMDEIKQFCLDRVMKIETKNLNKAKKMGF